MGSGMAKCSSSETYYKRRKGGKNDTCFAKEYSEYWTKDAKKGTFGMERNEYNFSSGIANPRRQSSFVSSFSAENSTSSGTSSTNSSQRYK